MQQGKPFETDNKTDKSKFVLTLLKNRYPQLENQITQRDAIINFLTNQLLQRQSHKSRRIITNIQIKSNDLHTVNKRKDSEITVES